MSKWLSAKNILCIRLDAMGDVIMTTPAMKALKNAVSGRKISLLTSQQGAQIAESIPLFDEVMTYPAPWLKASSREKCEEVDFKIIEEIKKRNFDGAVIFTVYSQNPLPTALLCYLAKIPLVASYCRENPYALLSDWVKEEEPEIKIRHEVRRHLDLVKALGVNGENLPLVLEANDEAIASLTKKVAGDQKDWIVIHPGATAESRRYSEERFAELADHMIEKMNAKILFTGSSSERKIIERIQSRMKNESMNLGGELSLKEMIALLKLTPLLISNNSGPVHMAAALGTPVVDLYALTNPQHTPWMVPNAVLFKDVPCRYCYKSICPNGTNECLDISPESILECAVVLKREGEMGPSYDMQMIHPLKLAKETTYDSGK